MKIIFRIVWFIYLAVIFLPIGIVATILTAVVTVVMSYFGDHRMWGYYPGKYWSRLMCAISFVSVEVNGKENIDKKQSYIFAANHQSLYDIFLIYGWIGVSFKWIMKKELRKLPFVGKACVAAGHIFIDRENPQKAVKSIEQATKTLSEGVSVALFPEGSRTKTGKVCKFKRGAFEIAKEVHLPIVPVTISGGYHVMPVSRFYPIPGKLILEIHPSVEFNPTTHEEELAMIENIRQTVINGLN